MTHKFQGRDWLGSHASLWMHIYTWLSMLTYGYQTELNRKKQALNIEFVLWEMSSYYKTFILTIVLDLQVQVKCNKWMNVCLNTMSESLEGSIVVDCRWPKINEYIISSGGVYPCNQRAPNVVQEFHVFDLRSIVGLDTYLPTIVHPKPIHSPCICSYQWEI